MIIMCLALLATVVITACTPGVAPTTPVSSPSPSTPSVSTAGKETWEKEWERVKQEARKEGYLSIYSAMGANVRTALITVFKEQFGVNLDILVSREAERLAKLLKERNAGIYSADLWVGGAGAPTVSLAPQGILEPLDKLLFLPEVLDKKAWYGSDLLWADDGHYQLMFLLSPKVPIMINTELVKPGEITSYYDLLNPKWKGKIVMEDPSDIGSGNSWFTGATLLVDLDYFHQLARQEPFIGRDSRLLAEWVARGKYPIGVSIKDTEVKKFKEAGAPLDFVTPKEGTHASNAGAGLSLINKAPHPNAAKLFINWILTKEGQTMVAKEWEVQSAREDVPTHFLEPGSVRQPGMKYINLGKDEYATRRNAMVKVAKEIFNIK